MAVAFCASISLVLLKSFQSVPSNSRRFFGLSAQRREQYGNNLGRKPSQMILNNPKSALL
jgi:hypothetical protein